MALIDWLLPQVSLTLDGPGIVLRPARRTDFQAWSDLRRQSARHLQPFEPAWPADDLTRPAFGRRLAAYERDMDNGVAFPFLIFRSSDQVLVGGITLSQIRRGVAQTGTLGYWIGLPYVRQGFASRALETVSRFSFEQLRLHRLEAACLVDNIASQKVLENQGFEREGLARAYLKINQNWRDHVLYARLAP
jgi:ribosomal-protein-alanine N-acetyltransferase